MTGHPIRTYAINVWQAPAGQGSPRDLMAAPKPEKPVRGTAECRRYLDDVRSLGCCICQSPEVQIHHWNTGRFSQGKTSDLEAIALCRKHHDLKHCSPHLFQRLYGFETELVAETQARVKRMRANMIGGRP